MDVSWLKNLTGDLKISPEGAFARDFWPERGGRCRDHRKEDAVFLNRFEDDKLGLVKEVVEDQILQAIDNDDLL